MASQEVFIQFKSLYSETFTDRENGGIPNTFESTFNSKLRT